MTFGTQVQLDQAKKLLQQCKDGGMNLCASALPVG